MDPVIALPAELTIYTVAEIHSEWTARFAAQDREDPPTAEPAFRLDAAHVGEVDAAGVQWLLSLANELSKFQRFPQFLHPSASLRTACSALGLSALTASAVDGALA